MMFGDQTGGVVCQRVRSVRWMVSFRWLWPLAAAIGFTIVFALPTAARADTLGLPASCAGVQAADPTAADGPQVIDVQDQAVEVYCEDMSTSSPQTYLDLPEGPANNYSSINYDQSNGGTCSASQASQGACAVVGQRRSYSMVRFDPSTLQIDTADQTYSTISSPLAPWYPPTASGGDILDFGYAADSDFNGSPPPPVATAQIDLRGTPFAISSSFAAGPPPACTGCGTLPAGSDGGAVLSDNDQVASVTASPTFGTESSADAPYLKLTLVSRAPANFVVSTDQVRRALFVAGEFGRLQGSPDGLRALVQERLLQELYREQPNLEASDAETIVKAVASTMTASGPSDATLASLEPNERILAILAAVQKALSDPASAVGGLTGADATALDAAMPVIADRALTDSNVAGQPGGVFSATVDESDSLQTGGFAPETVLGNSWQLAQSDAQFAAARDALWGGGHSILDSAPQLVSDYPSLTSGAVQSALIDALLKQLATNGSGSGAVLTDLENSQDAESAMTGLVDSAVSDFDSVQSACSASKSSTACTSALSTQSSDVTARAAQFSDDDAAGVMYAELLGPSDPALAEAQQAALDASTSFDQSFDAYAATKQQSQYENLGVGSAQLAAGLYTLQAGTVFSGLSNLLSGLGIGGGADKAIQNELNAISQQVQTVGQMVSTGFQQVDAALSTQYNLLQTDTAELASLSGSLTDIGAQLGQMDQKLDDLSNELLTLFNKQNQNALVSEADGCTNYAVNNTTPMDAGTFGGCANSLFSDATSTAESEPSAAPSCPAGTGDTSTSDMTDDGIDGVLTASGFQLDTAVNYLAAFPGCSVRSSWGGPLTSDTSLPDLSYWATAARAYAQLLLEHRSLLTADRTGDLSTIAGYGRALAGALAPLSANNDQGGLTGNKLFDGALSQYASDGGNTSTAGSGEAPGLTKAVVGEENSFLQTVVTSAGGKAIGIDPWAGPSQSQSDQDPSLDVSPPPVATTSKPTIGNCNDSSEPTIPTPSVFGNFVAGLSDLPDVSTAVQLGLGSLNWCYVARYDVGTSASSPIQESAVEWSPSTDPYNQDCDPYYIFGASSTSPDCPLVTTEWVTMYLELTPTDGTSPLVLGSVSGGHGYGDTNDGNPQCSYNSGLQPDPSKNFVEGYDEDGGCPYHTWVWVYDFNVPSDMTFEPNSSSQAALDNMIVGTPVAVQSLPTPPQTSYTLTELQQMVYHDLTAKLGDPTSELGQAAGRVDGVRNLIDAYIEAGLPNALESDDTLLTAVAGSDQPSGLRELTTDFTDAVANPTSQPPDQYVPNLITDGESEFAAAIKPHIGTTTDPSEVDPELSSTLDRLSLTQAVLTAPAPLGPAPNIAVPVPGASYVQGSSVNASYSCGDDSDGSPLQCVGPLPTGQPIDTSTPGTKQFTVTATDAGGHSIPETISYTVTALPASPGAAGSSGGSGSGPGRGSPPSQGSVPATEPVLSRVTATVGAHGTMLTYRLSTGARVHVIVERLVPGYRVKKGDKCVAGKGHGRACAAQSTIETMTVSGQAGTNTTALGGGLAPGNYVVTVTVTGGSARPVTVRFTEHKRATAGKKHTVK